MSYPYKSDRWITPGVLVALIVVGGAVVGLLATYVTLLTARGVDPDPVIKYALGGAAAVPSLLTFLTNLVGRTTQTKVERNTGQLVPLLLDVADAVLPLPPASEPVPNLDTSQRRGPALPVPPPPSKGNHHR